MAAGRVNVLKRRESYKYSSNKEFDRYGNGFSGVGGHRSSHDPVSSKSVRRSSSIFEDSGSGGTGSYVRREDREQKEFCGGSGGEIEDSAKKALAPSEKRRKISPIIWDLAKSEGANGSYHGSVVTSESPADSSCALPQDSGNEGMDVDQSEDNVVPGWNIRMCKWASDGYFSRDASDDEYMDGKAGSSPESGEFRGESSEGKKTRSSGSCGGVRHPGPSDEEDTYTEEGLPIIDSDIDEEHSESSYVSHPSSDAEDSGNSKHVHRNINMLQCCRSVFEFEMIKKINEGTYGVVYKAKDKKTGEIVALKKVKMNIERDGFPISALREINILLSFNHPSIVDVKEVVVDDFDGVFMVMEYMEYDLKGLMELMKQPFCIGEIKFLMRKLLEGVKYLHDNWILHRDLKTSNILLNKEGELKICDFGLSRQYGSPLKPYTPVVVTLWYRAPELLLGAKEYSTAIDMWSLGCIMAELVSKVPLFRGKSEVEQLNKIFQTLGTPNEKIWPGFSKLPGSKANFVKQQYNLLRRKFPAASFTGSPVLSESGFDLLSKLLTYDPEKRISAEAALLHDWFREAPLPKSDFNTPFLSRRC